MNNKLQVWWVPQVPMTSFRVDVSSVAEGVKILDTLADYDKFQLDNHVKPDYCNAGGLLEFNETSQEWEDWYDEESNEDDPRVFLEAQS